MMQSQSPIVSAPPPKKQKSDETTKSILNLRSDPPVDHIDDALARRRKQLQDLRRQQLKSDLLTKARSQLSNTNTVNGNNQTSGRNSNSSSSSNNNNNSIISNGFVDTKNPKHSIDHQPTLHSKINDANSSQWSIINASVATLEDTNATKVETDSVHVTPAPPSIPPQVLSEVSVNSIPTNAPSSTVLPQSTTLPSPASPEIVRRLNFVPSGTTKKLPATSATSELRPDAGASNSSPSRQSNPTSSPRSRKQMRPPPITPSLGVDTVQKADADTTPASPSKELSSTNAENYSMSSAMQPPLSNSKTTRQDFMSTMHKAADSPVTAAKQNSELHLIRELKKVHQDKEDAFRQVVRLREQIQKLQKHHDMMESQKANGITPELQQLVEIADRNGDRAALRWAREQASSSKGQNPKQSHLFSSHGRTASPSRRAMTGAIMIGAGVRKRVSTPHPKRHQHHGTDSTTNNASATTSDSEEMEMLAKATETNPDEFDSEIATYFVRRPYVATHNDDFWTQVGELSNDEYQASADVGKPSSLEVAAKIKADGSILLLFGLCTARHKKPRSTKWKIFEDVDDMDKPLGSVMFIDGQANEGEYWLDEIYEEAMSTRDTYCSSLIATASALKSAMQILQRTTVTPTKVEGTVIKSEQVPVAAPHPQLFPHESQPMISPPMMQLITSKESLEMNHVQTSQQMNSPPISQGCLKDEKAENTPITLVEAHPRQGKEMSTLPPAHCRLVSEQSLKGKISESPQNAAESVSQRSSSKLEKPVAAQQHDDEVASDILSSLLGLLFLYLFKIGYFILIRLPLRIVFLSTAAAMLGALFSIMWLYLANDHGADELGASIGYGFNPPGIE